MAAQSLGNTILSLKSWRRPVEIKPDATSRLGEDVDFSMLKGMPRFDALCK
jgi:hypothetical protein